MGTSNVVATAKPVAGKQEGQEDKIETKIPDKFCIMVELVGEPAKGKTDATLNFPKPLLLDTTPNMEAYPVMLKKFGYKRDEALKAYKRVRSLQDIRNGVKYALDGGFKTVIIDSSSLLQEFAGNEWCKENGKKSVFPITNFGQVREKIDVVMNSIKSQGLNVVLTSQMKDEYIKDTKTGGRIKDGYARLDFQADYRIFIEVTNGKRTCTVIKNRFADETDPQYAKVITTIDLPTLMNIAIPPVPKDMWNE